MLGEIRPVAFDAPLPPRWLECNGQLLNIAGNTELFSILGTTFGGNGAQNFQLPDLRGRVPIGVGPGPGLPYELGGVYGIERPTLTVGNLPGHAHSTANGNTGISGGNFPFDNVQPALALNFLITETSEITMFAGNFAPDGWAFCDGAMMVIAAHETLFMHIGTIYGGDGTSTFGLPDLSGRTPIGAGEAFGLSSYELGHSSGSPSVFLEANQMPQHTHSLSSGHTGVSGSSSPFDNRQPTLALNWFICANGIFPSGNNPPFPWIAELRLVAANLNPLGSNWLHMQGQILAIEQYDTLFNLIGTIYGGDGESTFSPPDLRGRIALGIGQSFSSSLYNIGDVEGSETVPLTINQMPTHSHSLPSAPVIQCPENIITNNISGQCIQKITFAAIAQGIPAPEVTYRVGTKVIASTRNFPLGTNTVTVTASNGVEPDAQCSFTVVVHDTEAPVMNCVAPVTVASDGGYCPKVVTFTAGASDCQLANLYSVPASGSAFPVGTNIVRTYAVDASGNSNSCTFTVTVVPGPQPRLNYERVGSNFVLSWSNVFGCYTLESSGALRTLNNNWSTIVGSPSLVGGNYYFTNAPAATNRFFRLRY